MSTKLKHQAPQAKDAGTASNVIQLTKCCADGCSKKVELLKFCHEHYDWFKFGVLTKEGKRPTDFDKKYQAYQAHAKKRAS